MIYNGLYWTDQFTYDEVSAKLRAYGQGYTSPKIVDAWVESDGLFGLPRQWAMSKKLPGRDDTVAKSAYWPKFKGSFRYDQEKCCREILTAFKSKYGALLECPTGWGKTVAALYIASELSQKTLVLVHKTDLIKQWQDSAQKFFGIDCGVIQGNKCNTDHALTVGMIQTLKSRGLPDQQFGMVIVDEGQHIPCETVTNILGDCPARYRLGVSATWRRSDQLDDLWKWHIGEVESKGTRNRLPTTCYQQKVPIVVNDEEFTRYGKIQHSRLLNWLANHPNYNHHIINEILAAKEAGRQILVVSHRIAQIEYFYQKIPDCGIYSGTFRGKNVSKEQLQEALEKQVILGTFGKVSEGTDIPQLNCLFLTTPCSDPEQVVGRVCRDHPSKKNVIIVDFVAPHGYGWALASKRKKIYESLDINCE